MKDIIKIMIIIMITIMITIMIIIMITIMIIIMIIIIMTIKLIFKEGKIILSTMKMKEVKGILDTYSIIISKKFHYLIKYIHFYILDPLIEY